MGRSSRALLSMVVGLALVAPNVAFAKQRGGGSGSGSSAGTAVPRTSGGSSSSSGGGSGSSGGSSSGESRPTPPPPPPPPPDVDRRAPTSTSSRTGSTAKPRSGSGTATGGSTANGRSAGSTAGSGDSVIVPVTLRNANGRAVIGNAVRRPAVGVTGIATFPVYGPWGVYSPWYGSGFGWNFGYVGFDPWYYYGTPWGWSPYGWYNPYYTYPVPYDPYYGGSSGYSSRRSDDDAASSKRVMGSLRIKASPADAKVYVDGTMMGTVDDFNGLSKHLKLEPGEYRLELRADGYETLSKDVTVTTGTSTIRLSLKKK